MADCLIWVNYNPSSDHFWRPSGKPSIHKLAPFARDFACFPPWKHQLYQGMLLQNISRKPTALSDNLNISPCGKGETSTQLTKIFGWTKIALS